jgi:hypothetical protein
MKEVMPHLCNLYNRWSNKRLIRLLALLLVLAVPAPVLLGGDDDHDRNNDREHGRFVDPIVGSWIVEVSPNAPGPSPFKNLGTFTEDGGNINSDPTFGGGHGLWKKVGPKTYAIKFLTIVPPGFDPPFPPETILTVSSEALLLNLQGDEMKGSFKSVFTPPNGQPQFLFDGMVKLNRITFDSTP